jgi:hypothetical protein
MRSVVWFFSVVLGAFWVPAISTCIGEPFQHASSPPVEGTVIYPVNSVVVPAPAASDAGPVDAGPADAGPSDASAE